MLATLSEWDVQLALFPSQIIACIRETQPQQWAALLSLHGSNLERLIIEHLARELDTEGTLDVLRYGFRFSGRAIRLAWFKPAHGLNPDILLLFNSNRLTVTRQVPCHPGSGDSVDLLFALNGVPVATCELKNPMTGQTWKNAVRQFEQDRNPQRAPVSLQKARACPLCGRYRRDSHDHKTRR